MKATGQDTTPAASMRLSRVHRSHTDWTLITLVDCLSRATEEVSLARADIQIATDPRAVDYGLAVAAAATQRWMQCVEQIVKAHAHTVAGLTAKANAAIDARLLAEQGGPVRDAEERLLQSIQLDLLSGRVRS
jgi:hypothetical protein